MLGLGEPQERRLLGPRVACLDLLDEPHNPVSPSGQALVQAGRPGVRQGDVLAARDNYHEAAAQLVLMAYLHRIVNGAGHIDREVGVGRGRIDLVVRQPYRDAEGGKLEQREAIELKVWADHQADPLSDGLAQLDGYLDRLGLDTGTLVVFDRRPIAKPIAERTEFDSARTPSGRAVTLLRA